MNTLHVKKGDKVIVISGKSKGHIGNVVMTSPSEGKVIVEGANIVTKHVKPRKQGDQGGIVKAEGALYACKVMHYCDKCQQGVRTSMKIDGDKKVRVCAKCGAEL